MRSSWCFGGMVATSKNQISKSTSYIILDPVTKHMAIYHGKFVYKLAIPSIYPYIDTKCRFAWNNCLSLKNLSQYTTLPILSLVASRCNWQVATYTPAWSCRNFTKIKSDLIPIHSHVYLPVSFTSYMYR